MSYRGRQDTSLSGKEIGRCTGIMAEKQRLSVIRIREARGQHKMMMMEELTPAKGVDSADKQYKSDMELQKTREKLVAEKAKKRHLNIFKK